MLVDTHSLTHSLKEAVYLSLLVETLLQGLPAGDTGSYPIYLSSDSEAALSISKMKGLLRRSAALGAEA